jgi:hypothetical protein
LLDLRNSAKKLGRTPSTGEIRRMTKIRDYQIRFHYINLGNALREAGLGRQFNPGWADANTKGAD